MRDADPTLTILVAEDDPPSRAALTALLVGDGHRVLAAADGQLALELLPVVEIDVAILDIEMPRLDGYEVARRIREREAGGVLLIALTCHGNRDDRLRAAEAGFDEHLVKPLPLPDLQRLLHEAVKRRAVEPRHPPAPRAGP